MTSIPFQPSQIAPFQAQVTLDGLVYRIFVTWNLFAKRFYLNVYALDGTRVLTVPFVGSPINYPIDLVAGYFEASTLVYYAAQRLITVTP